MTKIKNTKQLVKRRKNPVQQSVNILRTRKIIAKKRRRALMPFHKRVTLHPVNLLFLLCTGVLLVAWTLHAIAVSYTVTASVLAPELPSGAQITSPSDGQTFTSLPVIITGTCPPNSYVILTDNGQESGVSWCTNNTFEIQTGLYAGLNTLNSQDYNITDNPGPTTPNITLTYNPPANQTQSNTSSSSSRQKSGSGSSNSNGTVSSTVTPLIITTNFTFQAVATNQTFSTSLNVDGGVPPYQLSIDWGDGTSQTITLSNDPSFTINHIYHSHGYYPITTKVVDSIGNKQYLQTAAFIKLPGAASFLTSPATPKPPQISLFSRFLRSTKGWLLVIWPSYLVVLLMVFCFWLGEKEQYKNFIYHFKHTPKSHPQHYR